MSLVSNSPTVTPTTTCNGTLLKQYIQAGLAWFEQHYQEVNILNVFPVPDGDTGTNMLNTIRAAYTRIANETSSNAGELTHKLSDGAFNGSQGNSGTLLAYMLVGFAKKLGDKLEFSAADLAVGFRNAVTLAYTAPETPLEGTILTVAREMAEEAEIRVKETNDLCSLLSAMVTRGADALARTPDMLPILKEAHVVDSGGRGLLLFFEGMLRLAKGETIPPLSTQESSSTGLETWNTLSTEKTANATTYNDAGNTLRTTLMSSDPRGYAYDVQYILRGQNLSVEDMRSVIGKMGDSMIVVGDDTQIKVHIHVHNPGEPISYGASLGVISHVIVENMQDQATEYIAVRENNMANTVNEGEIAVITVAPGEGWRRVFQQLGATGVVSGGQSMNPSASDMIEAIKAIKTDKFLLLPNNKNILLTAESAAKIIREQTGQLVKVIPTRSLPQGVAAMLSFAASGEFERVSETMSEASRDVITGEITTASRDASFDGIEIGAGQLIALADGKLVMTSDNLSKIVHDLLEVMKVREHEVVTLYYGQPIQKAEAETVIDELQHSFPRQGFDLVEGGQPNYHFIISVE